MDSPQKDARNDIARLALQQSKKVGKLITLGNSFPGLVNIRWGRDMITEYQVIAAENGYEEPEFDPNQVRQRVEDVKRRFNDC